MIRRVPAMDPSPKSVPWGPRSTSIRATSHIPISGIVDGIEEIGTSSSEKPHTTLGSAWFDSYPNPVINNQLNLLYYLDDHAEVSIWSMTGEQLYISDYTTYKGDSYVLDVSFLPAGSYFLQIHFKKKNSSRYHLMLK